MDVVEGGASGDESNLVQSQGHPPGSDLSNKVPLEIPAESLAVVPIPKLPKSLRSKKNYAKAKGKYTPGVPISAAVKQDFDSERKIFVMQDLIPAIAEPGVRYSVTEDDLPPNVVNMILSGEEWLDGLTPSREDLLNLIKQITKIDLRVRSNPFAGQGDDLLTAFHRQFKDPEGYLSLLKADLEEYARLCDGAYYYPGVSIIQTSGSGKSRAVTELTKRGKYVVYCSFMRYNWTGFPRRSAIAGTLLSPLSTFASYFKACYEKYRECRDAGVTAEEFLELHMGTGKRQQYFWTSIEKRMQTIAAVPDDSNNRSHILSTPSAELELLFVFDEARQLHDDSTIRIDKYGTKLTAFERMSSDARLFKKQFGNPKERCRAFVVLIDTSFQILNVSPAAIFDPSARVVEGENTFQPLFMIGSVDVGLEPLYGRDITSALSTKEQYKRGRVLWQSLLDGISDPAKVRTIAIKKLAAGGNTPTFDEAFAAAVVRSRVPFLVHRSDLASELVASYMWWCNGISKPHQHLVSLPSEPVIADAGACWLHFPDFRGKILTKFAEAVSRGDVDVGNGGEVVAQLILIFGRDSAMAGLSKGFATSSVAAPGIEEPREQDQLSPLFVATSAKTFTGELDVYTFLQRTFASELVRGIAETSAELSRRTALADPVRVGKLSFTHFVPLYEKATDPRELAVLFGRSAAIRCANGTAGVDLIIPVLMPDKNGKYYVLGENMTTILVQVKNHSRSPDGANYWESATASNSLQWCGLDPMPPQIYLSLYMALGGKAKKWEVLEPDFSKLEIPDDVPDICCSFICPASFGPGDADAMPSDYLDLRKKCIDALPALSAATSLHESVGHEQKLARLISGDKDEPAPVAGSWQQSLAETVRRHRQVSIALHGLDEELYPCLATSSDAAQTTMPSLELILSGPPNPLEGAEDERRRRILERMVYPSSLQKLRSAEPGVWDATV